MQKIHHICQTGRQSMGWLLLLAVVVSLGLGACQPKEVELPFETIEQWDLGGKYENKEPAIITVSGSAEIAELEKLIIPTKLDQLHTLNLDTHFVLAGFQGWKPSTGYKVQIQRIIRQGNTVTIYTQFQEPEPDEERADVATSPYHLVLVQKAGDWKQDITFNLVVNETIIATSSRYVP